MQLKANCWVAVQEKVVSEKNAFLYFIIGLRKFVSITLPKDTLLSCTASSINAQTLGLWMEKCANKLLLGLYQNRQGKPFKIRQNFQRTKRHWYPIQLMAVIVQSFFLPITQLKRSNVNKCLVRLSL